MYGVKSLVKLVLFLGVTFAFSSETTVNIQCVETGVTLYIDGVKKQVTTAETTSLLLPLGQHELMMTKPLDEDWHMVARKNIEILDEKTVMVNLGMDIEKISKKKNTSNIDNFSKSGDTVIDKARNLVWQDTPEVITVKKNWEEAQAYCQALDGKDWRLPSYDELISIVDYTKHTLAIMPAFKYIVSEYYWSSNVELENPKNVKNVYFGNGCPDGKSKKDKYFIRCVHPYKVTNS